MAKIAKNEVDTKPVTVRDLILSRAVITTGGDNQDFSYSIADDIMSTETVDDLFADSNVESAEDWIGIPFLLQKVDLRASDYQESVGAYAVLTVTSVGTGATHVIACGATNVVAQLIRLNELGAPLPIALTFRSSQTAAGYQVLRLVKADVKNVQTTLV